MVAVKVDAWDLHSGSGNQPWLLMGFAWIVTSKSQDRPHVAPFTNFFVFLQSVLMESIVGLTLWNEGSD